jgi:hypothetical protein
MNVLQNYFEWAKQLIHAVVDLLGNGKSNGLYARTQEQPV